MRRIQKFRLPPRPKSMNTVPGYRSRTPPREPRPWQLCGARRPSGRGVLLPGCRRRGRAHVAAPSSWSCSFRLGLPAGRGRRSVPPVFEDFGVFFSSDLRLADQTCRPSACRRSRSARSSFFSAGKPLRVVDPCGLEQNPDRGGDRTGTAPDSARGSAEDICQGGTEGVLHRHVVAVDDDVPGQLRIGFCDELTYSGRMYSRESSIGTMSVVPSDTVEPARPTRVTYWEILVFDWIVRVDDARAVRLRLRRRPVDGQLPVVLCSCRRR